MLFEPNAVIEIQDQKIGENYPVYFVADIAANHDGNLQRAKDLIYLAKEAGADAAKFQHFSAKNIVSDFGFKSLGGQKSHQANWKKSIFEIYEDASISLRWTEELHKTCQNAGIAFMTSPYDFSMVDHVDPFVAAYKIGSGDITWCEIIAYIASKKKPYILATGASTMDDVYRAVKAGLSISGNMALMQCNTNYTGSLENMAHVNLKVLSSYRLMFPSMVLGLSDHTPGHATVLGSVALGARVIEKHFTDDNQRGGPDHAFSMSPVSWSDMVKRTRELEVSLGTAVKKVEANEEDTVVLQRRSVCAARQLFTGHIITLEDLCVLRPAPLNSIPPYEIHQIVGKKLKRNLSAGECIAYFDLDNWV